MQTFYDLLLLLSILKGMILSIIVHLHPTSIFCFKFSAADHAEFCKTFCSPPFFFYIIELISAAT